MLTSVIKRGGIALTAALALSACAGLKPEPFSCGDKVTAIEAGSRIELISPDTNQPIMIRLNGVSAECHLAEDGIVFDVSAGLKVTRNPGDSLDATRFQVPFILAVVNEAEAVIDHDSFGFRMALANRTDSLYPVVRFTSKAPEGGRIILSMTPEIIRVE